LAIGGATACTGTPTDWLGCFHAEPLLGQYNVACSAYSEEVHRANVVVDEHVRGGGRRDGHLVEGEEEEEGVAVGGDAEGDEVGGEGDGGEES